MKKLLFTLCAVLAGFAASAQSISFVYVDDEGTTLANNEVTVTPGVDKIVHVKITAMDTQISGLQFQYVMRDKDGVAHNEEWANVNIPSQKVGNSARARIRPEGMSTIVGNPFTNVMGKTEDELQEPAYRVVSANTTYNLCWVTDPQIALSAVRAAEHDNSIQLDELPDFDFTDAMFQLGNVYNFTIRTDKDWDEEYATLDMDDAYSKFSIHASVGGGNVQPNGALDLKIKNANWQAPLKDLAGTVEFTVDEATGKVNAEFKPGEGDPETVNIKVMYNGQVVDMPYQLTDGVKTTFDYEVTAAGYNTLTGSKDLTWNKPAPQLEDLEGEVTYTVDPVTGKVTVAYKPAEGEEDVNVTIVVKVDGQVVENPYQLTDGEETTLDVTVSADGFNDLTDSKDLTWNKPTVDTPVITFEETKDGEVVTAVDVVIVNYTSYTITNNDQPVRATVAHFDANYTEDQVIKVTAENVHADYPEVTATAEDTYTLKKLEKKNVPAPEVIPQTGDDAVTLNITWPESDGTHVIKVNGQETTNTEFPRQDADYTVELDVYVTAGATCNESAHYTETITIPKKVVTPVDTTGQPAFQGPAIKPKQNAYFYTITNAESEQNATIYYRIIYNDVPQGVTDENPEGWQVYTGEFGIYGAHDPNQPGQDGHYRIEAYAVAPGKAPSKVIATEVNIDDTTGIEELINGKAIANVRYFNMAGQEMQEANGITIVVTTYTDGTTSAVKVMK